MDDLVGKNAENKSVVSEPSLDLAFVLAQVQKDVGSLFRWKTLHGLLYIFVHIIFEVVH